MKYLVIEEAQTIEQYSGAKVIDISQDQLLGAGDYATIESQSLYDHHALVLCPAAVLSVWDRIQKIEKIESFAKGIQDPKEAFMDFYLRLTSTVNRMIFKFRSQRNNN